LNDLSVSISERQFGRSQGGPINFSLTEFRRARLDQATLTEANLMGAVLTEADLGDARLEKADLRGANLSEANLSRARLEGANLCGANLRLARGLKQAQIDQAIGDRRTGLPADLTRPKAWLDGHGPGLSQPACQGHPAGSNGDEGADPYEVLGVTPETAMQDIRVAWLKLVNEKRNDADEPSARERLKAINEAYQTLKKREHQATQQHRARSPRYVLGAILLVAAIAVSGLIAAVETHLARHGDPAGAIPAAGTDVKDAAPRSPLNARQPPPARVE
jgi:DnaJ-domain-containing protein 1